MVSAVHLTAQVAYALAFWSCRRGSLLAHLALTLPSAAAAVAIAVLCAPGAGPLLPAVAVYAAAIMMMAVLATGLGRLAGIGGAVFVVSDSRIALDAFGVLTLPAHGFRVMSTYLLEQLLLVVAVRASGANPSRTSGAPRRIRGAPYLLRGGVRPCTRRGPARARGAWPPSPRERPPPSQR